MIQPTALFNKCRFARDMASLGRIVAVLCNNAHIKRSDLSENELSSLEELENEDSEMDKRIVKEKEDARKRQKKYRERHALSPSQTETNGELALSHTLTNLLTNSLTSSPTNSSVRDNTHAHENDDAAGALETSDETGDRPVTIPTDDEMRTMAKQIGVPESYVQKFVDTMKGLGWGYVNHGGEFVRLNRRNFKAVIRTFFNQDNKNAAHKENASKREIKYNEGVSNGLGI